MYTNSIRHMTSSSMSMPFTDSMRTFQAKKKQEEEITTLLDLNNLLRQME